jgi:hypothetical protein
MLLTGNVGEINAGDGLGNGQIRVGRLSDLIVSELHGRFYEQAFRGNLFSGGMGLTSISAATFTSGTLGATCTPIAGVWNPATSKVNLIVVHAMLGITVTAATCTGGGPFVWASSTGNGVITTGNTPFNRQTMAAGSGKSGAKDMSGVALTGLTNNLVVRGASALNGGSAAGFSFVGTAVGQFTPAGGINLETVEGAWLVPPGGVLALLGTTSPVAHSAVSMILWEEVPVI